MKRTIPAVCCLTALVIVAALFQFVHSSPVVTATIGNGTPPQTDLYLLAGRQLYSLRLSASIDPAYQGDASLQLVGSLPAELILVNIGPVLHPLETRSYTLHEHQLLNLKAGEQIDLLVLLRSTGAPLAMNGGQAASLPACCQLPTGQAAEATNNPAEPTLVLFDADKLQKLWTIPLRIGQQEPGT